MINPLVLGATLPPKRTIVYMNGGTGATHCMMETGRGPHNSSGMILQKYERQLG